MFIGMFVDGDLDGGVVFFGIGFGMGILMVIVVVGIIWVQIFKLLWYLIVLMFDGVCIIYGLLMIVIEMLLLGCIFVVEVLQLLLWCFFGWWMIKINCMSGKSVVQQLLGSGQQFNVVFLVGKCVDVECVFVFVLLDVFVVSIFLFWDQGVVGLSEGDVYCWMFCCVWWCCLVFWKCYGYFVEEFGLIF